MRGGERCPTRAGSMGLDEFFEELPVQYRQAIPTRVVDKHD
jgi:hypothetical protein